MTTNTISVVSERKLSFASLFMGRGLQDVSENAKGSGLRHRNFYKFNGEGADLVAVDVYDECDNAYHITEPPKLEKTTDVNKASLYAALVIESVWQGKMPQIVFSGAVFAIGDPSAYVDCVRVAAMFQHCLAVLYEQGDRRAGTLAGQFLAAVGQRESERPLLFMTADEFADVLSTCRIVVMAMGFECPVPQGVTHTPAITHSTAPGAAERTTGGEYPMSDFEGREEFTMRSNLPLLKLYDYLVTQSVIEANVGEKYFRKAVMCGYYGRLWENTGVKTKFKIFVSRISKEYAFSLRDNAYRQTAAKSMKMTLTTFSSHSISEKFSASIDTMMK